MADYNPNQFTPEVGEAQRIARGERRITDANRPSERPKRPCPDLSFIIVKGVMYECDTMDMMTEDAHNHFGWGHGNKELQALWGDRV